MKLSSLMSRWTTPCLWQYMVEDIIFSTSVAAAFSP